MDTIRILIVDDHGLLAQGLASLLEDHSQVEIVGTASTAQEALSSTLLHSPDVVLMDHILPDDSGVEAARKILEALPDTKVLMLTQYSHDAVVLAAVEAGCLGFLTKDSPIEEVVAAIRKVADGGFALPPDLAARILPWARARERHRVQLSRRELEVLELLSKGLPNAEIAQRLYLSPVTVRNHIQNVITKLGVHSKLEAVAEGVRSGLISVG